MHTPASSIRFTIPTLAAERPARRLPLLASAAPVLGSVAMWLVTGSPFALLFAVLGPAIGIASAVDDRFQRRREARVALAEHAREVDAVLQAITAEHERERSDLRSACIDPLDALHMPFDPEWWRGSVAAPIPLCLGVGVVASRIELQHPVPDTRAAAETAAARVQQAAAVVAGAPVIVDARDGVGIVGPGIASMALARSVVTQLALQLSPAHARINADAAGCFAWALELPHSGTSVPRDGVEFTMPGTDGSITRLVCAVAERAELLPRDCRVVVHAGADGTAEVVRDPSGRTVDELQPWLLSAAQTRVITERATAAAAAHGLVSAASALPESVALAQLTPAARRPGGLPAVVAMGAAGPVTLDLVADGQHAIVGGTTGAGKSELLISWVLAMALATGPDEVNFLLVDFKGGSSFAPLAHLPHSVGVITDLDQAAAHRALVSLRAELRHRERHLARHQVRSLDELVEPHRLPRLVIVVDEYAVVVTEFPELQALFTDVAARGRSLGVHVILCTQRPAGTVRDAVMANCSLRLCLRVTGPADSSAVIGSPAAAELPPHPLGRCYLSSAGSRPLPLQIAISSADDADRVRQRWPAVPLRRPWCERLPAVVTAEHLAPYSSIDGVLLGLSDVPEEQCWRAAAYHPERDGNLIVFGGHGSGKTTALAAIARACDTTDGAPEARLVPAGLEAAWDTVSAAITQLHRMEGSPVLYLFDDIDATIASLPDDYRLEFIDQLSRVLREGPARGINIVLSTARSSTAIHTLLALCGSRLLLRMPSRQDHLLCGGEQGDYDERMPPGGGHWKGHRVQIALVQTASVQSRALAAPQRERCDVVELWRSAGELAVVVADVATVAERIRSHLGGEPGEVTRLRAPGAGQLTVTEGDAGRIVVADTREWQSGWGAAAKHIAGGTALFIGCTAAEIRSLSGAHAMPPPIGPQPGAGILRRGDGSMTRVQLPGWLLGVTTESDGLHE